MLRPFKIIPTQGVSMATTHVVGISDCKASANPSDTLVTYALGSCVGVVLYDPAARVGSLLHVMLPSSRYRSSTREFNPFMFADTGIEEQLELLRALGASERRIGAKLGGGANMLRQSSLLDIGKRNSTAILEILHAKGIFVQATSLGGTMGRSMQLNVKDGSTLVRLLGDGEEAL